MSLRFKVVEEAFKKHELEIKTPEKRPSEYFGKYVFNQKKMWKYLPAEVYQKLREVIEQGTTLDMATADEIAKGIGKPYSTLLRECNPYDKRAKLGALTLFEIMCFTKNIDPLREMAHIMGYELTQREGSPR